MFMRKKHFARFKGLGFIFLIHYRVLSLEKFQADTNWEENWTFYWFHHHNLENLQATFTIYSVRPKPVGQKLKPASKVPIFFPQN